MMAKATFDYDATRRDELTLKTGDLIEVTHTQDAGWWTGTLKGKSGVFPSNFVERGTNTAANSIEKMLTSAKYSSLNSIELPANENETMRKIASVEQMSNKQKELFMHLNRERGNHIASFKEMANVKWNSKLRANTSLLMPPYLCNGCSLPPDWAESR
jgi:hypothetical protein